MYLVSIFGHNNLSNCQHILFSYRYNFLHIFLLYSVDIVLALDISLHMFGLFHMRRKLMGIRLCMYFVQNKRIKQGNLDIFVHTY